MTHKLLSTFTSFEECSKNGTMVKQILPSVTGTSSNSYQYSLCYGPHDSRNVNKHAACEEGSFHYMREYKACCLNPKQYQSDPDDPAHSIAISYPKSQICGDATAMTNLKKTTITYLPNVELKMSLFCNSIVNGFFYFKKLFLIFGLVNYTLILKYSLSATKLALTVVLLISHPSPGVVNF